jgi:hypothetical protein
MVTPAIDNEKQLVKVFGSMISKVAYELWTSIRGVIGFQFEVETEMCTLEILPWRLDPTQVHVPVSLTRSVGLSPIPIST